MEDLASRFAKLTTGNKSSAMSKLISVTASRPPSRTILGNVSNKRQGSSSTTKPTAKREADDWPTAKPTPKPQSSASRLAGLLDDGVPLTASEPDDQRRARTAAATAGGFEYTGGRYTLADGFTLPHKLFDHLYDYQRDGVRWMWGLYKRRTGGVLGDDMGLGKTRQSVTFLSGLFRSPDHGNPHAALVVVPLSVIASWQAELKDWLPKSVPVLFFKSGMSPAARRKMMAALVESGGVCLTTYGMVTSNVDLLSHPTRAPDWNVMVLDEATKVKNPSTRVSKAFREIECRCRLLLSGTPIQNNLDEMWALFDLACDGELLGDRRMFNDTFGNTISAAQDRCASDDAKESGELAMTQLKDLLLPHFLRREKGQKVASRAGATAPTLSTPSTGSGGGGGGGEGLEPGTPAASTTPAVPATPGPASSKHEVVVWTRLTPDQHRLYDAFLESAEVKLVLNRTNSPLAAITVLKTICLHPSLLSTNAQATVTALLGGSGADDAADTHTTTTTPTTTTTTTFEGATLKFAAGVPLARSNTTLDSVESVVAQSGKLQFLVQLLADFESTGDRVLVFSQSKKMLDVVERVTTAHKHRSVRIDGDVSRPKDRQRIVKRFNSNPDIRVCLLTTGVGALGLTLTGATRVVILDPSWNPATDMQAVDRAYRLGQTKDVVTYRLITCGTVEEKMYRRQLFKTGLTRSVMAATSQKRYWTRSDLRDMFRLGDVRQSETMQLLSENGGVEAGSGVTKPGAAADIVDHLDKYLFPDDSECYAGVSDHDALFRVLAAKPSKEPTAGAGAGVGAGVGAGAGASVAPPSTPFAGRRKSKPPSELEVEAADTSDVEVEFHGDDEAELSSEEEEELELSDDDNDDHDDVQYVEASTTEDGQSMACAAHRAAVRVFGAECTTCRCHLSATDKAAYNKFLAEAREALCDDLLEDALQSFMSAVEICSDDVGLHTNILSIASHLEM